MRVFNQRATAMLAAATAFALAAPAAARPSWRREMARTESPVCAASYARAGARAREARLREASELYALCARPACSEDMRRECAARRAQVEGDTPSLVPLVTDDAGEPRVLVEVRVDGALATSRLDGRALPVDPGKHELTFGTDSGVFATRRLMVVQGERNRAIHVVLHEAGLSGLRTARELVAPPHASGEPRPAAAAVERAADVDEPAPAPARAARRSDVFDVAMKRAPAGRGVTPYLFGAFGLAGVGGFSLLTYWGRADNALLAGCAPSCTDASVRHVRELYWAADASLGVGVVSLAVSTWLFASHGAEEASAPGPVSLDLRPTRAGGVATVAGRF
jgi:hypothetical protein